MAVGLARVLLICTLMFGFSPAVSAQTSTLDGTPAAVFAATGDGCHAPGALRRSIELEAVRLAVQSSARSVKLTEGAPQSSTAEGTQSGTRTGKKVAIILNIAALAIGTSSLAYGYSDACRTGSPNDPDTCQQYRYVGLAAITTAAVFLPIAIRMK